MNDISNALQMALKHHQAGQLKEAESFYHQILQENPNHPDALNLSGLIAHHTINLHFGLLPRYGGCYPITWSVLNGEKQAGSTLHYMEENFDEGDIISQTSVPIKEETTARELFDSMSVAAAKLFSDTYPSLLEGTFKVSSQDMSRKPYYDNNSIDFNRDSIIDWTRTGEEIQRRICAFSFEPFQLPLTSLHLSNGKKSQATITNTRLHNNSSSKNSGNAGHITEVTDSGRLTISTGNGDFIEIGLLNNQPPLEYIESLACKPNNITFI